MHKVHISHLDSKQYINGEFLGKGSFGTVFLCTHKTKNKQFAVKAIECGKYDAEFKNDVLAEIKL